MINRVDLNPQTVQSYRNINSEDRIEHNSKAVESSESSRVMDIKSQIERGEYRLDMVATASKLIQEMF